MLCPSNSRSNVRRSKLQGKCVWLQPNVREITPLTPMDPVKAFALRVIEAYDDIFKAILEHYMEDPNIYRTRGKMLVSVNIQALHAYVNKTRPDTPVDEVI